jgi:hypothetical protein
MHGFKRHLLAREQLTIGQFPGTIVSREKRLQLSRLPCSHMCLGVLQAGQPRRFRIVDPVAGRGSAGAGAHCPVTDAGCAEIPLEWLALFHTRRVPF